MNINLDPGQVGLVTGISTIGIWLLTVLWTGILKRPKPSKDVLKILVFSAAGILAYFWAGFDLPDFSLIPPIADGLYPFVFGVLEFLSGLLVVATAIFKFAQVVFDKLWQPFLDWLTAKAPALAILRPRYNRGYEYKDSG